MTLRINSSILDAIDRVQFLVDYIKEIPQQRKNLEYDLVETPIEDIKSILNEGSNQCFISDKLYVTVALSAEEIAEKVQDRQEVAEYWVMRLVKWSEKEEYKEQIAQYLAKYSDKYADVIRMMQEYDKQK